MEGYRKTKIANKLRELVVENQDYTVAQLLHTIMRRKYMYNKVSDSYFMTDEDMFNALTWALEELRHENQTQ